MFLDVVVSSALLQQNKKISETIDNLFALGYWE